MDAARATGLVVGTGDFVYDVVRPWGTLPPGWTFGPVSHLAVDSRDRLYCYQRKDPPVIVLDRDGAFLSAWGEDRLRDAHGIHVDATDHVWVCDRDAHEVLKLTRDGRVVLTLGRRGQPAHQAPFNHPTDVAVGPGGEVFVSDGYGNACVHRFSADGRHLGSWGSPGAGPGQFSTPHGIWVDEAGRVLVADRENDRVQLFDAGGAWLGEWRGLHRPMDIYADRQGVVYVTDQVPRLSLYAPDGRLLARGRPVDVGAHGIWGDSRGDLYLAEVGQHRVTKLVRRRR